MRPSLPNFFVPNNPAASAFFEHVTPFGTSKWDSSMGPDW